MYYDRFFAEGKAEYQPTSDGKTTPKDNESDDLAKNTNGLKPSGKGSLAAMLKHHTKTPGQAK